MTPEEIADRDSRALRYIMDSLMGEIAEAPPKCRLTKAEREIVKSMFDGHCAYCGVELGERWHVDHIEAIIRNTYRKQSGAPDILRPNNHRMDNLFPACISCNIDKGAQSVESFREWIRMHLSSLHRQANFKNVMRHGLIVETGAPIVFYFERFPARPHPEGKG